MTRARSPLAQALGLLGWLALAFAAAGIGAVASADAPAFYGRLAQPSWAPPPSIFGPVWSLLYTLMGVAAWLVWRQSGAPGRTAALGLFVIQLAANAGWSWLFFEWRNGALAFAEVVLLLLLVVATLLAFWRVRRLAGLLLLPYAGWVSFAALLTWTLWRRNPGLL